MQTFRSKRWYCIGKEALCALMFTRMRTKIKRGYSYCTSDVSSSSFLRKSAAIYTGNNPLDVSLISVSIFHTDFDMVTTDEVSLVAEPLTFLLVGKESADAMLIANKIMITM